MDECQQLPGGKGRNRKYKIILAATWGACGLNGPKCGRILAANWDGLEWVGRGLSFIPVDPTLMSQLWAPVRLKRSSWKKQSGLLSAGKQTHMSPLLHTSLHLHVIYVSSRSVDHHLPSIRILTVGHQHTYPWGHGSALSFKVTECLCLVWQLLKLHFSIALMYELISAKWQVVWGKIEMNDFIFERGRQNTIAQFSISIEFCCEWS